MPNCSCCGTEVPDGYAICFGCGATWGPDRRLIWIGLAVAALGVVAALKWTLAHDVGFIHPPFAGVPLVLAGIGAITAGAMRRIWRAN